MPCAVLLFFLTGLSFEIKRIIIAFWALVKREIKIFLKNFTGGGVRAPRPTGGYKRCGKTGRCRHRPLRRGTRGMVQDRAGRENPALRGVTRGAAKRADVGIGPYGWVQGVWCKTGRAGRTLPYKRNTDWETSVRTGFAMTHRKKCDTSPAVEQGHPPLRTFSNRMS